MYEKKLSKSTFNKSITMETEHSLIKFFAKNRICNKSEESHRVSLQLLEFHQSSKQLKSAGPLSAPPPPLCKIGLSLCFKINCDFSLNLGVQGWIQDFQKGGGDTNECRWCEISLGAEFLKIWPFPAF